MSPKQSRRSRRTNIRARFWSSRSGPSTLAGITADTISSGLEGALSGLGISESETKRYLMGRIVQGEILVSVRCEAPHCVEKARKLFVSTGAEDISTTVRQS